MFDNALVRARTASPETSHCRILEEIEPPEFTLDGSSPEDGRLASAGPSATEVPEEELPPGQLPVDHHK